MHIRQIKGFFAGHWRDDPLRDEGIGFYRLLLRAGVSACCRQLMGACHAIEILPVICPNIARSTASDVANFAIA
jgi:acetyl esterase